MRLIPDWRRVLWRAWSLRLLLLAGGLSGLEAILPLFSLSLPLSREAVAVITFFIVAAAFVARLVAQKSISGDPS